MSDWKNERKKGIGGSDAAAILGFSPWKSPMDVFVDKMGLGEEKPADDERQFLLELGKQLEPVIAGLYTRETGKDLQQPSPAIWHHSKHPIILGTPDRIVAGERGVELKSENQFQDEFGEPGTDQVPYHYLIQVAHYMAISNMPEWDVALLHAGSRFAIYTVKRDKELEAMLIDELLTWWDKHIVAGVPPPVDGSPAWRNFLKKKYPANILPLLEVAPATLNQIAYLGATRLALEQLEERKANLENLLKSAIGDHEGIIGDFGKVTWRKTKDKHETDWLLCFTTLAKKAGIPGEVQNEIVQRCTLVTPGTRRFLFSPRKEWDPYGAIAKGNAGELPDDVAAVQTGDRPGAAETPER